MRKVLLVCIAIFLLAVTINPDNLTGITGLLLQVSSVVLTIARSVVKQILTFVVKML